MLLLCARYPKLTVDDWTLSNSYTTIESGKRLLFFVFLLNYSLQLSCGAEIIFMESEPGGKLKLFRLCVTLV